jgi:hypothetical protein
LCGENVNIQPLLKHRDYTQKASMSACPQQLTSVRP